MVKIRKRDMSEKANTMEREVFDNECYLIDDEPFVNGKHFP